HSSINLGLELKVTEPQFIRDTTDPLGILSRKSMVFFLQTGSLYRNTYWLGLLMLLSGQIVVKLPHSPSPSVMVLILGLPVAISKMANSKLFRKDPQPPWYTTLPL